MADVAKSAVRSTERREGSGGGEEGSAGEEEETSLSAAIESELRGVLGKGWSQSSPWPAGEPESGGWATVEEVALELTSSAAAAAAGVPSPPSPPHPPLNGHLAECELEQLTTECLPNTASSPPQPDSGLPPTPADTELDSLSTPQSPQPDNAPSVPSAESENSQPSSPLPAPEEPTPQSPEKALHLPLSPSNITTPLSSPQSGQLPVSPLITETPPTPTRTSSHRRRSGGSDSGAESDLHEEVRDCMESVLVEVSSQQILLTNGQHIEETEISESTIVEKKKKKKTAINGDAAEEVTTAKKKTKKSKKTEGKENHISIVGNGYDGEGETPPPLSHLEDYDLSNVCVKNLKLNYVNEAQKSFNSPGKPSEVPVPPPVPIRELRRSFGDIHKACENVEPVESVPKDTSEMQLAAQYWQTVSIENNLNERTLQVGRLDKSSFSKFDQLSKKTVLHVRSSDPAKAQKTFSQGSGDGQSAEIVCKACQKQVFVVEKIMAERANWHKNCFRCHTCNKQLTVDTYQSHEGNLYCKPHFRELFAPKAVLDNPDEPTSDKPDLGLEELSSLNVKSRFQVFERGSTQDATDASELERSPTTVSVKRSSSIMSKLAKFQKKGMDVGVTDESLNGFVYEETSSSEEESDEEGEEDKGVIKCRRKARERPVSFGKMDDVKKNWESLNQSQRREEIREERKLELQQIRSRMFQGKQGKMKELYEAAVAESQEARGRKESLREDEELSSLNDKAKSVRERFEKGEIGSEGHESGRKELEEDLAVFEEGISKKSRNIFKEMEASSQAAKAAAPIAPPQTAAQLARTESARRSREAYYKREPSQTEEIVRSSDVVEDVVIETADVSSRFKFFETYKEPEKQKKTFRITPPREGQVKSDSPEREVYRDPDVVRCGEKSEDESQILRSQTASKMLSMFRQMEEHKEVIPDGPKPKKCFTPPPERGGGGDSSEEGSGSEEEGSDSEEGSGSEGEESETEEGVIKSSYKVKDEFLEQAKKAARAKQLAAKFEKWEPEKQSTNNAINMLESEHASIESTKSLKARFESLQSEQPKEKSRPKVNRFVEQPPATLCAFCDSKVYPLEKIETNGKIFHKNCFRCSYCNCILRMDTYTLNNGHLYCLPHFKQLFISKGNYDEGFGSDQHKRKWEQPLNGNISN